MARSGKFNRYNTRAAKIDAVKVIEIRRLYAEYNWSQSRLSIVYGVHVNTIGRIVRGESWQGIETVATDQELADQEYAEMQAVRGAPLSADEQARIKAGEARALELAQRIANEGRSGAVSEDMSRLGARYPNDMNAKIFEAMKRGGAGAPKPPPPQEAHSSILDKLNAEATAQKGEQTKLDNELEALKIDAPEGGT